MPDDEIAFTEDEKGQVEIAAQNINEESGSLDEMMNKESKGDELMKNEEAPYFPPLDAKTSGEKQDDFLVDKEEHTKSPDTAEE